MAMDSVSTISPSTRTGSFPAGLILRNSGFRCSPAIRLTDTASNGTSSSWSVQRARIERVGANSKSFMRSSDARGRGTPAARQPGGDCCRLGGARLENDPPLERCPMKAVAFYRPLPIDDPASLVDVSVEKPAPAGCDLLVKVAAVSVNPVDTKVRRRPVVDAQQPKILGWDAAGLVEAVG